MEILHGKIAKNRVRPCNRTCQVGVKITGSPAVHKFLPEVSVAILRPNPSAKKLIKELFINRSDWSRRLSHFSDRVNPNFTRRFQRVLEQFNNMLSFQIKRSLTLFSFGESDL